MRVDNGGVLSSEFADLLPEKGVQVEVVGELVEEGRAVEGFIMHFFE